MRRSPLLRWTSLMLVAMLLAGCLRGQSASPELARDPVELVLAYDAFGTLDRTLLADVVKTFEREHPHVRVRLTQHRGPTRGGDGQMNYRNLAEYDLIVSSIPTARWYHREGLLRDLSQVRLLNWDPLAAPFVDALSIQDGDRIMLPMRLTFDQILYSPAIFQALGIAKPAPTWTYAEFAETLQQLKQAGRPASIYYGSLLENLQRATGGGFYDAAADSWAFDTPENRHALGMLAPWVQNGLVTVDLAAIRVTYGSTGTPMMNLLLSPPPQGFEWLPYPRGPQGRKSKIEADGVMMMATTRHPEEALALLQALVASDVAVQGMARQGHRPVIDHPKALQAWRQAAGELQANLVEEIIGSGWVSENPQPPFSYSQDLQAMLEGRRSLDDLLADLERRLK